MKTEEEMCEWAHYSFGIHRGRAFTPVHCRLCGYKAATETKWRADVLPKMPHFCSNITDHSKLTQNCVWEPLRSDIVRTQAWCTPLITDLLVLHFK